MSEEPENTKLLREILKWIRFAGMKEVKDVLQSKLDSDAKKIVYHLSDGQRSTRDIQNLSNVSKDTVRNYWQQWYIDGIVEPIKAGTSERFRKVFSLEDFGIQIPQIKAVESTTRNGKEVEGDG